MPTVEEHKRKYAENKELLNKELDICACSCYDWIVTVSFYAAMHLIEGNLAKNGIHNKNHVDRGIVVERFSDFKNIRSKYKILHDRSVIARYGTTCMDKKKAEQALKYLEDIEKEINI